MSGSILRRAPWCISPATASPDARRQVREVRREIEICTRFQANGNPQAWLRLDLMQPLQDLQATVAPCRTSSTSKLGSAHMHSPLRCTRSRDASREPALRAFELSSQEPPTVSRKT